MADATLVHSVFFTLKERSPAGVESLVSACRNYLAGHEGILHFSVGPRANQYVRPVNDAEFDVALIIVFNTVANHDAYQQSPRHREFIAEQSERWAKVRVFDSCS